MISEILLSLFGGGVTGLFGTLLGRVADILEEKQERNFILQKYELYAKLRSIETEKQLELTYLNTSQKALKASYEHDTSIIVNSDWVNNIRALVRPVLTLLLWLLVAGIYFNLEAIDDEKGLIIESVIYASTTATVWWFGDRSYKKK
jgi:lipopolysaccharide export system protein LptC